MQGVSLWHTHVYKTASEACGYNLSQEERHIKFKLWLRSYMNSPYFDILDKQDNIWGWPFYTTLGGKTFKQPIPWVSTDTKEHIISESDGHPNGKGHQKIASRFMEIIK